MNTRNEKCHYFFDFQKNLGMTDIAVPLLDQESPKKKVVNWTLWASLILSIIAIILGVSGFFKTPTVSDAITATIPLENVEGTVEIGQVVSLNKEGKLCRGEGTTITKNVQKWEGDVMTHLHSTNVGENLVVSAYDGFLLVTYVTDEGHSKYNEKFELPLVGKVLRRVDDVVTLGENTVIVLGSTEILPITVEWKNEKAVITPGKAERFTGPESFQPVMDTLSSECLAISYFYTNTTAENQMKINLATRTGCLSSSNGEMTIKLNNEVIYSDNYMFHGIAGLSPTKYVLAKSFNEDGTNKDIIFQLATVSGASVTIGPELVLKNRTNFGFFDMDNLNDHQVIVTFIDGDLDNGLESVLIVYNRDKDCLIIGPFLDNQDGGASGMSDSGIYNFIFIRVMSETRFGVFYSNILNQGATALCLGEVTPANDLIAVGPEYVISSTMLDPNTEYYWLGECSLHRNRLILTESLSSKNASHAHAEMHIVDIKALPLGVVVAQNKKEVTVAVSGRITAPTQLVPGRNYYGDNNGKLIMGEYVGSMNTESYYIYVESDDGVIVSDDNRVGFALDSKTLFLKVHN